MTDFAEHLIAARSALTQAEHELALGGAHTATGLAHLRVAISALLCAERAVMEAAGMPPAGARA